MHVYPAALCTDVHLQAELSESMLTHHFVRKGREREHGVAHNRSMQAVTTS